MRDPISRNTTGINTSEQMFLTSVADMHKLILHVGFFYVFAGSIEGRLKQQAKSLCARMVSKKVFAEHIARKKVLLSRSKTRDNHFRKP